MNTIYDPEGWNRAWLEIAQRASVSELRRLIRWARRTLPFGAVPPGFSIADVLDLQLTVLRQGLCRVPFCRLRRSTRIASARRRSGEPPFDPENRYGLCATHRRLVREGFLRVEGPPDAPTFRGQDGVPF